MAARRKSLPVGKQTVAVDRLWPSEDNPREISDDRLADLKDALNRAPRMLEDRPIIALPSGEIVAGHQRHLAATQLLEDEPAGRFARTYPDGLPTSVRKLTPRERQEWKVRDNVPFGEWVEDDLAELIAAHQDAGGDVEGFGLPALEIEGLLARAEALPLPPTLAAGDGDDPVDDEIPAPPRKPTTRPGDMIELGRHRLLCGDSTDPAAVERIAPDGVDLIFTSPPYNVGVKYHGQTSDDKMATWDEYGGFLRRVLEAWLPALKQGRAIGWNVGVAPATYPAHQHLLLEDLGLRYHRQVVWDKMAPSIPQWHHVERDPVARNWPIEYQHELVLLFSKGKLEKGERLPALDDAARTTVMKIAAMTARRDVPDGGGHAQGSSVSKPKGHAAGSANKGLKRAYDKAHPAVFPAKLPRPFIAHLTGPGELVADPFAGAGTTALAAERLDRPSVLMEIDPGFCDVIVERWETVTGQKAKRPRRRRRPASS